MAPTWQPINGQVTAIDAQNITINGTAYPLNSETKLLHGNYAVGDSVQIMRNKEGFVTMIGKVKTFAGTAPPTTVPVEINRRDELIIRQNALAHADAWIALFNKDLHLKQLDEAQVERLIRGYFEFAERCEQWIRR